MCRREYCPRMMAANLLEGKKRCVVLMFCSARCFILFSVVTRHIHFQTATRTEWLEGSPGDWSSFVHIPYARAAGQRMQGRGAAVPGAQTLWSSWSSKTTRICREIGRTTLLVEINAPLECFKKCHYTLDVMWDYAGYHWMQTLDKGIHVYIYWLNIIENSFESFGKVTPARPKAIKPMLQHGWLSGVALFQRVLAASRKFRCLCGRNKGFSSYLPMTTDRLPMSRLKSWSTGCHGSGWRPN